MRLDFLIEEPETTGTSVVSEQRKDRPIVIEHKNDDFDALLQSLYDATVLTTFDGQILNANWRALSFFGYELESICQFRIFDLIFGVDDGVIKTICSNIESHRFTLLQAYCIRHDQASFPAEISVTALQRSSGQTCLCFFVRDISLRIEEQEQLRIEGEAIRNAADSIVIASQDGCITYHNPALRQTWRFSDAFQIEGNNVRMLFPENNALDEAFKNIDETGVWRGELETRTSDGAALFLQTSIQSSRDETEAITHFVFCFIDITQRRENELELIKYQNHLEELIQERTANLASINRTLVDEIRERSAAQEELRKANEKLHERDRAKNKFVSNVSHELRTPLTSMIHSIENMLRGITGTLTDKTYRYLIMMLEDCWRLDRTINDILDLSRIETGTFLMNSRSTPFLRMVERSFDCLRFAAESAQLEISLHSDAAVGFVECDIAKIERVLINIISNAIKFTPEQGQIILKVSRKIYDNTQGLECTITDTGTGIPEHLINRVTERYFRVGEQVGGTGLGLAISKEIAARHNGALIIESPPPNKTQGTAVTLWLPLVAPQAALIVSAPGDLLSDLNNRLIARGYVTTCVHDGGEAIQMLRDNEHHIAIIASPLEGMSASEVVMHIKADQLLCDLRVCVLLNENPIKENSGVFEGLNVPVFYYGKMSNDNLIYGIEDELFPASRPQPLVYLSKNKESEWRNA